MHYFLQNPIPLPWFFSDLIVLALSLVVVIFIINKSKHPAVTFLEAFAIIFVYTSIFENFAIVNEWYVYGRSYLMVGYVPLIIPLLEMDIILMSLWGLDKMEIPTWCKPFIAGFFGMLLDFSLDPVMTRLVYRFEGLESGKWTWLLPKGDVNIFDIPVYNFSGWMLFTLYIAAFLLLGRWWFKRSGYKTWVGYTYPFLAAILSLIVLVTPLSRILLWVSHSFWLRGTNAEWVMMIFYLVFSVFLLAVFWRGRMKEPITFKDDLPFYLVPIVSHGMSLLFVFTNGIYEVLWLVLLAMFANFAVLAVIYYCGYRFKEPVKTENTPDREKSLSASESPSSA
ncbi:MAG: carotenoid biosynthesis protein [Actinobacteria bacterium]|nr:carotenoid biosynthesis protein [Actinomycetota bacterium]